MESTESKILIGIALLAVGWLLGQGGKLFDEYRTRRRLKRQLLEELKHIQNSLTMAHQDFLRTLQLSVHDVAELSTAQKFPHPIFENFYRDCCSYLSSSQRESFDRIHLMIDAANRMFDQQSECAKVFCFDPSPEDKRWWREMAKFQYLNIREIDYLIGHHLDNPEDPGIRFGEIAHRDYLKYSQQLDDEVRNGLEAAKEINPRDASTKYHPEMFPDLDDEEDN